MDDLIARAEATPVTVIDLNRINDNHTFRLLAEALGLGPDMDELLAARFGRMNMEVSP